MIVGENFTFFIENIDPLGQGVDKSTQTICFIPKTLPNEKGQAIIKNKSKGVAFAELQKLEQSSEHRVTPVCKHFDNCDGCHFLHTSYEHEVELKQNAFNQILQRLGQGYKVDKVISAPNRFNYRNRIQLHYNKKIKKLGYFKRKSKFIHEVPECLIATPVIQEEIKNLYNNKSWLKLVGKEKNQGHIEILDIDGKARTSINKAYADGGFTQVYEHMNQVLKKYVRDSLTNTPEKIIFDLFSGSGNLTRDLKPKNLIQIDIYPHDMGESFYNLNLFDEESIAKIPSQKVDTFIIDPPRSGFKLLSQWIEKFDPTEIIYVSCDPQTLIRDLKSIQEKYKILEICLMDLFPSTYHFESIIKLEKL